MDWLLYNTDLRHERVNQLQANVSIYAAETIEINTNIGAKMVNPFHPLVLSIPAKKHYKTGGFLMFSDRG